MKFLVTAGPTREYLDPARFLSNPSTGKMGYALAEAARKFSHEITLISGPVALPKPRGVKLVSVQTAAQMAQAVLSRAGKANIVILAAAVADYRPAKTARRKIKKSSDPITIKLVPTLDIAAALGRRKRRNQILAGFAAETDHLVFNARKKLRGKNLDLVVANRIGRPNIGFGSDTNRILLLDGKNRVHRPRRDTKKILAQLIIRRAVALWRAGTHSS